MNDSLLLMQVLLEIAMSIGNSLDLKEMLQESLSSYLQKLNCAAGAVLTLGNGGHDENQDGYYYSINYTIPREIRTNSTCLEAMKQIPERLTGSQLTDFLKSLPLQGEINGNYYHIMELPDFGLLLLVKSGVDLEMPVIRSLKRLNIKLARSGIACKNNQEVRSYNRQLKDEMQRRKQMEEQLLQARKMEAIGTLAGGVAHDFNNLLSIILGNLSLAMIDIEPGNNYSPRLDDVEDATMKARDLANKFITFSSGGKPFPAPCNVKKFLEEVHVKDLQSPALDLRLLAPGDLRRINMDKGQMKQALLNIIENAIEAQAETGSKRLNITVRNVPVTETTAMHQVPPDTYVVITVQDKGVGIAEDQLPKIFDPYYSTKRMGSRKGTGLGLSIAHSIVQKHGGFIIPRSQPNQGTTISIYLPAMEALPDETDTGKLKNTFKQKQIQDEALKEKKRILIMDDEPMMLDMLSKMAKILGYRVTPARDGKEAVQLYSQSMDTEEPIDAVILDLTIKNGMNGEQGMKKLLKLDPEIVAVASSGNTENPMISSYSSYGFKGALEKPFSMGKLREVLKTVLH